MGRKPIDLKGQKFGRLTVIERAENRRGRGDAYWLCKCECGNEKIVRSDSLKSGGTTSCGCYSSEKMKQQVKEFWQDNNFRQMRSEQAKQQWEDEEYKKMQSEKMTKQMKKKWQENNNFRQMQSEKAKQQWQDEDYRKMQKEARKGSKNPNYKGGITPITEHLRHLNTQWYDLCKQQANYTCQLTGKRGNGDLNTHHLYAFSSIVKDAHTIHNITIKPQVKDYTEQELQLLEEYVFSYHKDNSNAVVLSEDVHTLFHNEYGYGDNTPQQYEEFKQRYLAGEFNNLDSNSNVA